MTNKYIIEKKESRGFHNLNVGGRNEWNACVVLSHQGQERRGWYCIFDGKYDGGTIPETCVYMDIMVH